MEISIVKNPRFIKINDTITQSQLNDLIIRVLDGEVIMFEDDREVSIDQFVQNGDFLMYCQSQITKFLCGNTAILEQINDIMKERIESDLRDAFNDYDIKIVEG